MDKTKVIFRVDERDNGYEVLAVFPALAGDGNPYRTCLGYAHIGQHSAISSDVMQWTRPAKQEEYQALYNELVSIGHNLEIGRKFTRKDLQAREEQTRY